MDGVALSLSLSVLVISALVLAIEGLVLYRISQESRERSHLIRHLSETRRVLTRDEYIRLIAEQVESAETEVLFVTSALHIRDGDSSQDKLEAAKRKALGRGVSTYEAIIPHDASRVASGWSLASSGVEVFVHDRVNTSDLNFTVVDRSRAVVGESDTQGGSSARGFVVDSGVLASLLRQYYIKLRDEAIPFKTFAVDVARQMEGQGLTEGKISERTGIPLSTLQTWMAG